MRLYEYNIKGFEIVRTVTHIQKYVKKPKSESYFLLTDGRKIYERYLDNPIYRIYTLQEYGHDKMINQMIDVYLQQRDDWIKNYKKEQELLVAQKRKWNDKEQTNED